MIDKPTLISQGMVSRSLGDPTFFQRVPEFTPFKAKLKAMHVTYDKPSGCGGCKHRKVQHNLYQEYITVVQALSADGLARLKQYFGVQRFMLNNVEPKTHRVTIKII